MDTPTQGTVDGSGNGTLTIDADAISPQLNQGAYLLTVTIFDQATEASSTKASTGVEMMRLLPGLEAKGTISFASDSSPSTGLDITEGFGEIQIEAETGYTDTGIYILLKSDANISTDNVTIYANGENIADTIIESSIQATTDGIRIELSTLSEGENVITCIVSSGNRIGAISAIIEWPEPPSCFTYIDNGDGTCTITGQNPDNPLPSRENLNIPEKIDGLMVTAISDYAFWNSDFVSPSAPSNDFTGTLTLPEGLQTIGSNVFRGCGFTNPLVLPASLQTIGSQAFIDNSFTGDLIIPSSVTEIGNQAFRDNSLTAIYCEVETQPSGWNESWNYDNIPVTWGYTGGF